MSVVYLASSLALAALELLVHIDYSRALTQHVAIPVTFDASLVLRVRPSDLPADWPDIGGVPETQALGAAWVREASSALLAVPSAVVPHEVNYLLNPLHPQAGEVQAGSPEPFRYDPRLLKR